MADKVTSMTNIDGILSHYFVYTNTHDEIVLSDFNYREVCAWTFHYTPNLAQIVEKAREDADKQVSGPTGVDYLRAKADDAVSEEDRQRFHEQITAAIDAKVAESDFAADADERSHLAGVIRPWTRCDDGGRFDHGSDRAADAVLAAGYSRTPDAHLAVTSVESECSCGGTAACQQCQERDAHLAAAKADALEEAADEWDKKSWYDVAAMQLRNSFTSDLRARAARLREQGGE